MAETLVIGVDVAVEVRNVGICSLVCSSPYPLEAHPASRQRSPAEVVAGLVGRHPRVLLSLDAPLGWPVPLGNALGSHRAGAPLAADAHSLFRRETDRFVKRRISKQPLDVGADRIARTAHAALEFLERVRVLTGERIPLVWDSGTLTGIGAIEVYPAGTLKAHGLPFDRYKKPADRERRELIASQLGERIRLPVNHGPLLESPDVLHAAICVLAGIDFLEGRAMAPEDPALARREGWIWVTDPVTV